MRGGLFSGSLVPASKKLPGVHGLRAVAALMVLMLHLVFLGGCPIPDALGFIPHSFDFGVHLFFILSAFSLANSIKLTADGIAEYAIKRFFRIAPLFYAILLYSQILNGPLPFADNILNLTFTFNLAPRAAISGVWGGWSNGVEVIFYAILPVILAVCRKRRSFIILALLGILLSWAGHKQITEADPEAAKSIFTNYAWVAFVSNFAAFPFGLLAYAIYRDVRHFDRLAAISLMLAAALIILLAITPLWQTFHAPGRPGGIVLMAALGLICVSQAAKPSRLLTSALMQHIGERSYSVYLIQFPMLLAMKPIFQWFYKSLPWMGNWAFVPCALLSIAAIIAVSNVTYRFVEVAGVNAGRWIIQQRRAAAETIPAGEADVARAAHHRVSFELTPASAPPTESPAT